MADWVAAGVKSAGHLKCEAAVLADGPRAAGRASGEGDGEFVGGGGGGRSEDRSGGERGGGGPVEFGEGGGPAAVGAVVVELRVVEIEGCGAGGDAGDGRDGDGLGRGAAGKLDAPPHLGAVHVDHALWGPNPVVLGCLRDFFVAAGGGGDLPPDAGEVYAPLGAFGGSAWGDRGGAGGRLKRGPRKGDFEGPAGVGIGEIVEGAAEVDGGFKAGDFPGVVGFGAVHVGLGEEEVPAGVEGVEFEFVVGVGVAVGIEEDFEIGVVENHGVVLRERGPEMRIGEFGGDVEVGVVPEDFGAGAEVGLGFGVGLDVDEVGGPRSGGPGGIVELAVDGEGLGGAGVAGDVGGWDERRHAFAPRGEAGAVGGGGPRGESKRKSQSEEGAHEARPYGEVFHGATASSRMRPGGAKEMPFLVPREYSRM